MRRLRRSELAVPGNRQDMIDKALVTPADVVFCDLEDAVPPAEKDGARAKVIEALAGLDWGAKGRAVRVNSLESGRGYDDIVEIVESAGRNLDFIVLPKVKSAEEVRWVDRLLSYIERKAGVADPIRVEVLIEDVQGLIEVEAIARAGERVEAVVFGAADLSASQGARVGATLTPGDDYPGDFWHYTRCRIVVAARAAGIDAVDCPHTDFEDHDGYRRECARSSALGFVGKWAIHPSQIDIANDVYSPTEQEMVRARYVLEAYEGATERGAGAIQVDGVLVDEGVARIMREVLERAR